MTTINQLFLLRERFAGMKIEDQDNNIVNTTQHQAMDLEYYADGNSCFNDVDMIEVNYNLQTILCKRLLLA